MLNVPRLNPFNTRSFVLQTVGAFVQIQTLVHQLFKLQSSNGESGPSSSCKILSSSSLFGITFLESHLKFFFCPLLIGSSYRNLDSCRGSVSILLPWARRNLRPFWFHRSRIPGDSLQDITVETPWVARRFQELASAPNRRLEKLV
jgi:hypothetical protein